MKRIWIILLAAAVFAVVLIARLPASWILPEIGHGISCATLQGSLWDGYCGGATLEGITLDQLAWTIHPTRLLLGKLAASVQLTRGNASARADVVIGAHGTVTARNLVAEVPLDPRLLPGLPPNVTGRARIDLKQIQVTRRGIVRHIQGRIEVRNLIDSTGEVTPLGSFALSFPGGAGEPVGQLRDLGGPLYVDGTVRLTAQPGYDLQAMIAPRSSAVPSLLNALQYLGSPDDQGRRPFSLSGTY